MHKKIITLLSSCLLSISITTVIVNAATAITYDGKGIWSSSSKSSWKNSGGTRKYTVNHSQTKDTASNSNSMTVYVKKDGLIATTQASSKFYGNSNGKFSVDLGKGTYFLRFESNERAKKFNIKGTVTY